MDRRPPPLLRLPRAAPGHHLRGDGGGRSDGERPRSVARSIGSRYPRFVRQTASTASSKTPTSLGCGGFLPFHRDAPPRLSPSSAALPFAGRRSLLKQQGAAAPGQGSESRGFDGRTRRAGAKRRRPLAALRPADPWRPLGRALSWAQRGLRWRTGPGKGAAPQRVEPSGALGTVVAATAPPDSLRPKPILSAVTGHSAG